MLLSHAESKDQDVLNAMVYTKPNTTINLHSVVRLTLRLIL